MAATMTGFLDEVLYQCLFLRSLCDSKKAIQCAIKIACHLVKIVINYPQYISVISLEI